MNHFCDLHDIEYTKHEKDGESWYSHKLANNKWCNEGKEAKEAPATPQKGVETREPIIEPVIKQPDWDSIARGKVRNSVAVAFIPLIGQMPVDSEIAEVMETWVEWIMSSKTPKSSEDVEDIELPSEIIKNV